MALFKNINFNKLKEGLSKTKDSFVNKLTETISGRAVVDEALLDDVEEILITSDIGFDAATRIIENARFRLRSGKDRDKSNLIKSVKDELAFILKEYETESEQLKIPKYKPYVILVVGVNGAGKTTTIGKLAYNYKKAGYKVVIGSADTFRAAANEQLEIWAGRAGVEIVQSKTGADPSSVAFEAVTSAQKSGADIVLIDTAGRLHTKTNLMEELRKITRTISKALPHAPNEVYLVLDGNTGQNALVQADKFSEIVDLTGLIVTKLDGTAKGGVIFQICARKKTPVKYIGVGEGIEDLQTFDPDSFVNALFE
ncbi:MAG TPA: signal recognition particle-docking protein FtsY [Ignavibacteriales bacterium]|nr:signal recognition particle-docking protein FtsY [Ignavibacteriales bacterium]